MTPFDKFHEECGVTGVYGHAEAAKLVYLCLYALQHRGQEGCGIAVSDGNNMLYDKGLGLVADYFSPERLEQLPGDIAIGHNRYSTAGDNHVRNTQPFVADLSIGRIALVHNGNLVNAEEVRAELVRQGAIFTSTSDSETILHLIARLVNSGPIEQAVVKAMERLQGAYSIIFLHKDKMIGIRDPFGFRPLILGKTKSGYALVSETVALDLIEGEFIREIEPGEMIVITREGVKSYRPFAAAQKTHRCVFEHIYFARPDTMIFGQNVYDVRKRMGRQLALENPVDADVVIPVPDSGIVATLGYSEQSGIPFEMGLIRNHYVGRTFIEPAQSIRHFGVKIKLNPVKSIIKGKRVIVIDDSIVRGTTSRKIVKMLREAGAKEVHMRIASPPTMYPCFYGIDTPTRKELIASTHTEEEICKYITADSLAYLSLKGVLDSAGGEGYCHACFSGEYPAMTRDASGVNPKSEV